MDVARVRPTWPGWSTRAGSSSAPTPTSWRSPPDETFTVTTDLIRHKHPVTPYLGTTVAGRVRNVWLRGTRLADDIVAGQLLTKWF